jgi:hypothetical protein
MVQWFIFKNWSANLMNSWGKCKREFTNKWISGQEDEELLIYERYFPC